MIWERPSETFFRRHGFKKSQRCLQYLKGNTPRQYQVSSVTIYRILKAARLQLPAPQNSTNNRFKQAKYGMKRLAKVEKAIKKKLTWQPK